MNICCNKWIEKSVFVYITSEHGWSECSTKCKYCPECGSKLPAKEKLDELEKST